VFLSFTNRRTTTLGLIDRARRGCAGHTTLAMTLRYMHLSPAHKREAIDRLDRVRGEHAGHQLGTSAPART
jgi:hypothetical protein